MNSKRFSSPSWNSGLIRTNTKRTQMLWSTVRSTAMRSHSSLTQGLLSLVSKVRWEDTIEKSTTSLIAAVSQAHLFQKANLRWYQRPLLLMTSNRVSLRWQIYEALCPLVCIHQKSIETHKGSLIIDRKDFIKDHLIINTMMMMNTSIEARRKIKMTTHRNYYNSRRRKSSKWLQLAYAESNVPCSGRSTLLTHIRVASIRRIV